MLKPFYQGKLDTFCAIYAVLNALQITHSIRVLKARDILNETLLELAGDPAAFRAVLTQETDYVFLVDGMLHTLARAYPLEVIRPCAAGDSLDRVWDVLRDWLTGAPNRAAIFRFLRHYSPEGPAKNRHWTVADRLDGNTVHLFDCSHEAEAILNLPKDACVTRPDEVSGGKLLVVQPETLRLVRLYL